MVLKSIPAQFADAGVQVVAGDSRSIAYRIEDRIFTAVLVVAKRISSPTAVLDRVRRQPGQRILVVCQAITDQARTTLLNDGGVDLSIGDTDELVLRGAVYENSATVRSRRTVTLRRRRRQAAERVCLLARDHLRQVDIADAIGVSQQAVSQMVVKDPLPATPMDEAARRAHLAAMSSISVDDGLVQTYWYGMEPVIAQVRDAIGLGDELTVTVLAGAEVAADVLRPWRVPTQALAYSEELIDLSVVGLVPATAEEATLILRVPADPTVWTTAVWWKRNGATEPAEMATVDPVIVLQDLLSSVDLGDGAPQRLADWIVQR